MFGFAEKPLDLPSRDHALPGREQAMIVTNQHFVTGRPIKEPFPDTCKQAGCLTLANTVVLGTTPEACPACTGCVGRTGR